MWEQTRPRRKKKVKGCCGRRGDVFSTTQLAFIAKMKRALKNKKVAPAVKKRAKKALTTLERIGESACTAQLTRYVKGKC